MHEKDEMNKIKLLTENQLEVYSKGLYKQIRMQQIFVVIIYSENTGGGRVVRWCWVNFQCRGVQLLWKIVGQGPTALVVGAGGGCLDIFSLIYHFSLLSSLTRLGLRFPSLHLNPIRFY